MNSEITPVTNQAALHLIEEWLVDDSGYDEEVWPILQELIEQNRLSSRRRFSENQDFA